MRIAQLAELVGTTPRAIRHYHAIGLLPVPRTRSGYRSYDLSHVARLGRIRWFVGAGLSLTTISGLLSDSASPREDLVATIESIDSRIAELTDQGERLARLVDALDSGAELSPMPDVVADFYAGLLDRAKDDTVRRRIMAERDFTELGYYRGIIPPEAALLYDVLDDDRAATALTAFARMSEHLSATEVEQQADEVVARIEARLGDPELARRVDTDVIERFWGLFVDSTDDAQRRVAEAAVPKLVAAIERWRSR